MNPVVPLKVTRTSPDEPESEPVAQEELERQLEALMLSVVTGDRFERLAAIVHEHLFTGAPRPRGELVFAATEALGVEGEARLGWAATCALLHSASLVHDDVQDASRLRRGAYSVWVRHGPEQAINAGDLLLMLPNLAIAHIPGDAELHWKLSLAASERAIDTVRGQSLEMCLMSSHRRDWSTYREAISKKTSIMMALPVQGAGLLAGWSAAEAQRVAKRFEALGFLRQLAEDLLDMFGEDRSRRGTYVREGRMSSLVLEHLRRRPDELSRIGPILGTPAEETTSSMIDEVTARILDSGARAHVEQRFEQVYDAIVGDPVLGEHPELLRVARAWAARIRTSAASVLKTPDAPTG